MKKIPTLFVRLFEGHKVVGITDIVLAGMEWVLEGEGYATVKYDGACCAVIDGELYKRHDAKKGKKPPAGAIPCGEADPVTGHHPHWAKADRENPADKWFFAAYENPASRILDSTDATYEAIGMHFNGNPYGMDHDELVPHGKDVAEVERSFQGIKKYLEENYIEGLVFWKDGQPQCKIKRSDFGFEWSTKKGGRKNDR